MMENDRPVVHTTLAPAVAASTEAPETVSLPRRSALRAEQIRLLYANSNVAVGVTIFVSSVLCFLQWQVIPRGILLGWLAYMLAVSSVRFALERRYRRVHPSNEECGWWGIAFTIGAGLSAAGWAGAGILLYPEAYLTNQVLLVFVVGGMMLGAGAILASRPEAMLIFLLPAGLATSARFLLQGGSFHLAMGTLMILLTAATIITNWHIYQAVSSSLMLRFENDDLVTELQVAKQSLETLNQELEQRVQQRTTELDQAVSYLKKEIAERQRAEEERSALEASLRQAQKMEAIGALAGGIAHDFNNLLTVIAGYTKLVRETAPKDPRVSSYLEEVLKASTRAGNLVRRLLVFSQKNEQKPCPVPVADVVGAALDLMRGPLPARVSLHQNLDPECGYVFADPNLIQQVVLNLCTNSIEAMAQSGGQLQVTLEPVEISAATAEKQELPEGPYVRLTVRDTGPGIPPNIVEHIFEPFRTTKSPGKGAGLGLSVVHGIVTTYGGLITFESTPLRGTAFVVLIPRLADTHETGAERADSSRPGCQRVLLVDDEEAIARLTALLLRRLGHTVTSTVSSIRALRLFMKEPDAFDLVITDLTMPQMNGKELIRRLKQIRADIPVILMSGFKDASVRSDQGETVGIGEFLPKPFSQESLEDAIRRVLQKKPGPPHHGHS